MRYNHAVFWPVTSGGFETASSDALLSLLKMAKFEIVQKNGITISMRTPNHLVPEEWHFSEIPFVRCISKLQGSKSNLP